MIFTFTGDDKGFDKVFHGRNLDINKWESMIPSPMMDKALFGDPALQKELYGTYNSSMSYIGSLYLYNQITSTRIAIGKIAKTLGFLQTEFTHISNIFKEDADSISIAISTADAIINSEYFDKGLDALGAIPIVGWIIKIIVKAAELIYKIVKKINDKKIENVRKELAGQFSIPLTEFSKEADEILTRFAMDRVAKNDLNYIFSPRYIFNDLSDFVAVPEKVNPNDQLTRYFNVRSEDIGGLGFIPGTVNLAGALRFPTKGCAGVYDTGDLYPTVRSLGSSLNQIILKPGPALFGLDPNFLIKLWENNIYNILAYAEESIKKGWSCYETGIPNTNEWKCAEPLIGAYGDKACKKPGNVGKIYKTFSSGHYAAFRSYIIGRYFGNKFPTISGKSTNPDNIDISKSIPVQALKNIENTQKAVIDSNTVMYINLEKIGNNPKYIGLYNNSHLIKKWQENVTLILNSDEWKKIRFYDVPDGEVKNALYDKAKSKGYNPEKPGPIVIGMDTIATKSVLKNPKPPSPFEPIDVDHFELHNGTKKKPKSGGGTAIVALGILGTLGYIFKNKG